MIDNTYLECLNNLFYKNYCKIYDPSLNSTLLWNYRDKGKIEYEFTKGGKTIIKTEKDRNPIHFTYLQLILIIIRELTPEIDRNVNSLIGSDKTEYLNSIIESWEKLIENRSTNLEALKRFESAGKIIKVLNDTDTFYPLQVEHLSKELEKLKNKYSKYLLKNEKSNPKEIAYKNMIWFKVGLLFANGEMAKLIKQYTFNGRADGSKIANHLGNKNYKGYINETINNTNKTSDKNIYSNQAKLQKIQAHCIKEKITIDETFLKQIKSE